MTVHNPDHHDAPTAIIDERGDIWVPRRDDQNLHTCGACDTPIRRGAPFWHHHHQNHPMEDGVFFWRCNPCMTGEKPAPGRRTPRGTRFSTWAMGSVSGYRLRGVQVHTGDGCVQAVGYYVVASGNDPYPEPRQRSETLYRWADGAGAYLPEDITTDPHFDCLRWWDHLGELVDGLHALYLRKEGTP